MDISCEMELPFSEPTSLTGSSFESSSSDLPVKLLGSSDEVDHLLHGNTDKHLSAADFKLDLGPANDLVSDFGISSESLMMQEESSEGYSISDAALEGGVRPAVTSASIVSIDNINYVQSIPLVSTLSGIQTVQVIPFGYLISGSKPDNNTGNQSELVSAQTSLNCITPSTSTQIQAVHNAVVIGNLMMLKSLPGKQLSSSQNQINNIKQNEFAANKLQGTANKCFPRTKSFNKAVSNGEMSRRVAHKNSVINNRLKQQSPSQRHKVQSSQKNTKVKIDGKTISLTFEVKDIRSQDLKEWQKMTNSISNSTDISGEPKPSTSDSLAEKPTTKPPQLQILTNIQEAPDNTRYVSILNGRGNSVAQRKNEDKQDDQATSLYGEKQEMETNMAGQTTATDNTSVSGNEDIEKDTEKSASEEVTEELENEVLTLLAKASEERSRVEQEQSKQGPGRKKSGKPCGNLPTNEELFKCDICGLTFNRHGNFTRHKLIHDVRLKDRYKCSECDRKFLQRCDLKRHLLIHTNQEPYRCQECGKGYIRRSDLVVHMRFHKKERVFACPYCTDKKFCQSGDLNRHVRNVHLHSSTFKCSLCERQFSRDSALIQHEYTCHANSLLQPPKKSKSGSKAKSATKKKVDTS